MLGQNTDKSFWDALECCFLEATNVVGFNTRRALHQYWKRKKSYCEQPENKTLLTSQGKKIPEMGWYNEPYCLSPTLVEKQFYYQQIYPLSSLWERSACLRWLENLTILDYLHQFEERLCFFHGLLENKPLDKQFTFSWLDVGSKNWAYVDALWAFIVKNLSEQPAVFSKSFLLEGVELDPYRIYRNGFCRLDYAESYIQNLPDSFSSQAHFYAADIMDWQGPLNNSQQKYDVISCFLPFVFENPHRSWGLPKRYFKPLDVFNHLLSLLRDDGVLIITNQGQDEYHEQLSILKSIQHRKLEIKTMGEFGASFIPYQYSRWGILVKKIALPVK